MGKELPVVNSVQNACKLRATLLAYNHLSLVSKVNSKLLIQSTLSVGENRLHLVCLNVFAKKKEKDKKCMQTEKLKSLLTGQCQVELFSEVRLSLYTFMERYPLSNCILP